MEPPLELIIGFTQPFRTLKEETRFRFRQFINYCSQTVPSVSNKGRAGGEGEGGFGIRIFG